MNRILIGGCSLPSANEVDEHREMRYDDKRSRLGYKLAHTYPGIYFLVMMTARKNGFARATVGPPPVPSVRVYIGKRERC